MGVQPRSKQAGNANSRVGGTKNKVAMFVLWGLVVGWMAFIFWLSSQSGDASSSFTETLRFFLLDGILASLNISVSGLAFRKIGHAVLYFVMAIFTTSALYASGFRRGRLYATSLIICFVYAITDEVHQYFIPGRSAEFTDVLIDTFGAALAILLWAGVYRFVTTRWKKRTEVVS